MVQRERGVALWVGLCRLWEIQFQQRTTAAEEGAAVQRQLPGCRLARASLRRAPGRVIAKRRGPVILATHLR